jgi:hypothetical protein
VTRRVHNYGLSEAMIMFSGQTHISRPWREKKKKKSPLVTGMAVLFGHDGKVWRSGR